MEEIAYFPKKKKTKSFKKQTNKYWRILLAQWPNRGQQIRFPGKGQRNKKLREKKGVTQKMDHITGACRKTVQASQWGEPVQPSAPSCVPTQNRKIHRDNQEPT